MDKDMKDGGCACGPSTGSGPCGGMGGHGMGMGRCGRGGRPVKTVFLALALLALASWLGFKARNEAKQFNYIGVPIERNTITVFGEGKVVGIPDIAAIDLGTTIEKATVAEAQGENTRIMNLVNDYLKSAGVDAKDVQTTSYNVNPNYDWNNGIQKLRSYSVTQNVHVKVRDLGKVGEIIGKAGSFGANQIGGIQFTIDDPEKLKAEARDKAIADAKTKAEALGKSANVKIVRLVSFQESTGGYVPGPMMYDKAAMSAGGAAPAPAPTVEVGSNDVIIDVTLTYEIQ